MEVLDFFIELLYTLPLRGKMAKRAKRVLPIGVSDFKKLRDKGFLYIDKSLLIQEIIEQGTEVALIPRPRRFGKTLNLSMLRYFFEKSDEDRSYLFKDLKIWEHKDCRELQGRFPVIFFTLKDIKYSSWKEALSALQKLIAKEFIRHGYLAKFLKGAERKSYQDLAHARADKALTENSLELLVEWVYRYHDQTVMVLIDEYDAPAHFAYTGNYYEDLIGFMRNWLSGGLKDSPYLERAVLTGILRIAKESVFSGLNNVSTFTLLTSEFQDKFGLVTSEVKALLKHYSLPDELSNLRQWYDGYLIGEQTGMYNPWSVLNCIKKGGKLSPYWVNTSDNALMKKLILNGSDDVKIDIERLVQGECIEKIIEEGLVFPTLDTNPSSIWALLLYSGYLTLEKPSDYGIPSRLRIPNIEVAELYKSMILEWFDLSIQEYKYKLLLTSLAEGDVETFSQIFKDFIISSASVFDIPETSSEKIYHAFVLGMLIGLRDRFEIKSNRESGLGRYDVMLIPKRKKDLGIVMEFKKIEPQEERVKLEEAAESALRQIEERNYIQELLDRGVKRVLCLGLAFKGKQVLIRSMRKE